LKRDDQARFGGVASVLTRNGGQWTPDKKLIGTGAVGKSAPAVALSADGSIVMIGGSNDNGGVGATWVFMRWSRWPWRFLIIGATTAAREHRRTNAPIVIRSADLRSGGYWTQDKNLVGTGAVGKSAPLSRLPTTASSWP
jgi:hypothetical protein